MTDVLPKLQGAVARLLEEAKRRADADDLLEFERRPIPTSIPGTEERAIVIIAGLMLEHVRKAGGSRVNKEPLERVLKQLMRGLSPSELMTIEVELYDVFNWLAQSLNPQWSLAPDVTPGNVHPDSSYLDVIKWAMHNGEDLQMAYYHPERGELTHRQVTPLHIRAQTYLLGFCHLRMDERIFRLSRIGDLHPVSGWPTRKHEVKQIEPPIELLVQSPTLPHDPVQTDDKDKPSQMSFFGEEEE